MASLVLLAVIVVPAAAWRQDTHNGAYATPITTRSMYRPVAAHASHPEAVDTSVAILAKNNNQR